MAAALFSVAFLDQTDSTPLDYYNVRVENADTGVYTYLDDEGNGRWSKELGWGSYHIQYQETEGGDWTTAKENHWHGTKDAKTHAEGTTDQHGLSDITFTPSNSDHWPDPDPTTGQEGMDDLAERVTDIEAWDADDMPYTPTTPADWDEPNPTETEGALDQLAERLRDLETGEATAPTGIEDFLSSLGVVVNWSAQEVNDIQYKLVFLWKHTGESVPVIENLGHGQRSLAPEVLIPYFSRLSDLDSSPDSNLILYYAIGAAGRADVAEDGTPDWHWSEVQSIEVELPEYTQEFRASLAGITLQCNGSNGGTSELVEAVRCPNLFPSADANPPTENMFIFPKSAIPYQYTENITIANVEPDEDVTLYLRNAITGETKTFTIGTDGRIDTEEQAFLMTILAETDLWIYTLDAHNMGDVTIWLRRVRYTG